MMYYFKIYANVSDNLKRYCESRRIEILEEKRMTIFKSDNLKSLKYIKNYYYNEYNITIYSYEKMKKLFYKLMNIEDINTFNEQSEEFTRNLIFKNKQQETRFFDTWATYKFFEDLEEITMEVLKNCK